MGVKTLITAEEYLQTSFDNPDKEYRDGVLEDRSLPDNLHSKVQVFLCVFFFALRQSARLFPRSELRVKLRDGRYMIPDVSVFHGVDPVDAVPSNPPLIAVEILSPDDSMSTVRSKLEDYRIWGVPHVWLIDPHSRRLYTCDGELREVAELTIPELSITIPNAELFE